MVHLLQTSQEARASAASDAGPLPSGPYALEGAVRLRVLFCAPGPFDLVPPPRWPRVPGAVTIGKTADGAVLAVTGYLPCGVCDPCQSGLQMACLRPWRPGWNAPGGMGGEIVVPAGFLVPLSGDGPHAEIAVLLAAAGPTYQAVAAAGMAPGDTVLVIGDPGPGALPLRLLAGLGLRPVWVHDSPAPPLPPDVLVTSTTPAPEELPSPRRHLLDLTPSTGSLERWAPAARSCISCTLVGPAAPATLPCLEQLFAGEVVLRRARDLHPHLALDLAALVRSDRIAMTGTLERHDLGSMPLALAALARGGGDRWPVLVRDADAER